MIPLIKDNYTNIKGEMFYNVREISYKKDELFGNLGRLVAETKKENDLTDSLNSNGGVYIYQSHHNPDIAYRIYKEFAEYNFNGYNDDKLIQKLLERQNTILKTKFPTGVITLEGKIIGQEIPYYKNSITLLEYIKQNMYLDIIDLYINTLEILFELYKYGIIYIDIHSKNFVINPLTQKINLIDFDFNYVKFDDKSLIKKQLYNYKYMIDFLNNVLNISIKFNKVDTYEQCFEQLNEMSKKLIKKY